MRNQKDEKEIAATIEKLRMAMVDANKTDLEAIASKDLSYGHSGGHVEGKEEFVDKIVSGKSDFVSISLSNQNIHVVGDNAIVRHDLQAATNDGG